MASSSGTPLASWRRPSAPTVVLGIFTIAFVIWFLKLEHRQWFVTDEWDYFHGSLIHPHNEHTIVFVKAWFQLLLASVGLRAYALYALPLVVSHVATAWLGYRLLRVAGVTGWTAAASALATLCMGAGAGTLTWAGQLNYTGSVAAGLAALLIAVRPPQRGLMVIALAVSLFGTFNGSGYLIWGVTAGLLLCWRRLWAPACVVAAIPIIWMVLVRAIWHPGTSNAARDAHQVLNEAPGFVRAVLNTAITQTLLVDGFTPVIITAVLLGFLALLRGGSLRALPELRQLVAIGLGAGLMMLLASLTVARLGRGAELASNGGYSYLILAALIPLSGLLLDRLVGSASMPVAATCIGALWLSASGCETLRRTAVSLSGWKQDGMHRMQTTVFLLQHGLTAYPDQVPVPGTAPTVMQSQLLDYARRGLLVEQDWGAEIRDQASLNLQWRARAGGTMPTGCVPMAPGASFTLFRGTTATMVAPSGSSSLMLTYSDSPASRELPIGDGPTIIETLSDRPGTVTVLSGALSVCIAPTAMP